MTDHPRPPVELQAGAAAPTSRFGREVPVDDKVLRRLRDVCPAVETDEQARLYGGRDWWPVSIAWAVAGTVPARPGVVVRPSDPSEVAAVLAVCADAGVPATAAAGRSGVCGGAVPVFGGVALDLRGLDGIVGVDDPSLTVDVRSGTYGDWFEQTLRDEHGLTLGHWPQSIELSTVGGWLACRSAGQYSTRYGKVEDMVVGLEVALANGRLIRTGHGAPRAAAGPDLNQVFVGSEGTLGVITAARLRVHPVPGAERRGAWAFGDFAAGLDACRRILRRGATPAVLRLYDQAESARTFDVADRCVLIALDEADPVLVEAVWRVVGEECAASSSGPALDEALVGRWLEHRNQVPPIEELYRAGIVADTIEVAGSWTALPEIHRRAVAALSRLEPTIVASAHQSHAYPDGGCLYFTFAGRPAADDPGAVDFYYRQAWDAVMGVTLAAGGALSHHHGVGINRGRHLRTALGGAFEVLVSLKAALDPKGVLNPGKLGLPSPFGEPPWL